MMAINTLNAACETTLREVHHSKISAHHAKTGYKYPTIHLPFAFSGLIGLSTRIYQTAHDGALAFLVVISPSGSVSENAAESSRPLYLHGEGRAFESPRAHCFFFDSEAEIVSDDEREQDKKLHNSEEELHNSGPGILTTDANGSQTTWAPNGVHTLNAEYIGDPSLPNASITVTKVTP